MKQNNTLFKNPKLLALLSEYSDSHRNGTNQKIHKVAVPAIMLSLLGLIKSIPCPIDLSSVFLAFCFVYYAHFKDPWAIGASLVMILPMLLILEWMRPNLFFPSAALFGIAWAAQFYGHHVEGKKPSFFKDVSFLLIGPLWVAQKFLRK
jgi:uncharacterized membrane protein YGL010W